jgi:E3 ubiquitin-protein ligase DOA10
MLNQLRKLAFGAIMYAILIVSNVGGVIAFLKLPEFFFGLDTGPGKIWPLKWEFTAPLSEFPIDLLVFHFLVPWTIAWTRPRTIFKHVLENSFRISARLLRMSHFMFGERRIDEESEEEEDDPIIYHSGPLTEHAADSGVDSSSAADKALHAVPETDIPAPKTIRQHRREFPYMRVPNHDHIEIIPRQKVLIPMRRGQPLRGRSNETDDDIRANWTRVYVPNRFKLRVAVLIFLQWLCIVSAFSLIIGVPRKSK